MAGLRPRSLVRYSGGGACKTKSLTQRSKPKTACSDVIEREVKRLCDDFEKLIKRVTIHLRSEKKELHEVYDTLLALPRELAVTYSKTLTKDRFGKCECNRELFLKLNECWSFIDFDLLDRIIKDHGNEKLRTDMISYRGEICKFRRSTTVYDLIESWKSTYLPSDVSQKYKELVAQLDQDPEKCTVEELESIRKKTSNSICDQPLSIAAMILHEITYGSVTVVWLVAAESADTLSKSISQLIETSHSDFIDRYKIEFLSLDDYILYPVDEVSVCVY